MSSFSKSEEEEYIKKLRIPPNWNNVKISHDPLSKIQVTGEDAKGRTQYIYHPIWNLFSKDAKYSKVESIDFKKFLRVVKLKSKFKGVITKDYTLANMFILMKDLNIRVGNEVYLQENDSVGLTTMSKIHYKNNTLDFLGKKGVHHIKQLNKEHILFIEKLININGKTLFQYLEHDIYKKITSSDMNDFLKINVDENMTTKDIRTYCANELYKKEYSKLLKTDIPEKKAKSQAIKYTAEQLGNTVKVCRDSYLNIN